MKTQSILTSLKYFLKSLLLMKKIKLVLIVILLVIASISLISIKYATVFAEEKVKESDSVNDIVIKTVFHFRAGEEEIDSFKVFSQISGFIRTKSPVFALQGVVDGDRPLLYEAVDRAFQQPNSQNEYSEFDVDVYLHNGDSTFRHFVYTDCSVQNYFVDTEFDKEETYSGKTKFAVVDKFEFLCRGFDLENPVYDKMLKDKQNTEESLMKHTITP